jgi:hypothetical protein
MEVEMYSASECGTTKQLGVFQRTVRTAERSRNLCAVLGNYHRFVTSIAEKNFLEEKKSFDNLEQRICRRYWFTGTGETVETEELSTKQKYFKFGS